MMRKLKKWVNWINLVGKIQPDNVETAYGLNIEEAKQEMKKMDKKDRQIFKEQKQKSKDRRKRNKKDNRFIMFMLKWIFAVTTWMWIWTMKLAVE